MAESRSFTVASPVVNLTVTATPDAVTEIRFGKRSRRAPDTPFERKVGRELEAYFAGRRTTFSFRLAPNGTPFEQRVWQELLAIPYGETRTYGEIAARLRKPGAARAVGTANGRNPIPIVIPCHRVVAAGGKLGGYGGGLDLKRRLLELEGRHSAPLS